MSDPIFEPIRYVIIQASDDLAKEDNELVCCLCGKALCDVEGGDELEVIVSVALDHSGECPGPRAERDTRIHVGSGFPSTDEAGLEGTS
jgi:hypothetical protein